MDINQLDFELEKQKDNINVLQECLKNINDYIQNMNLTEDTQDITELLRQVKSNLDNCKNNVNMIAFLKSNYSEYKNGLLNNVESTTYEKIVNSYGRIIQETSNNLNSFLSSYLNNSLFTINAVEQNNIRNKLQGSTFNSQQQQQVAQTSKFFYPFEQKEETPVEATSTSTVENISNVSNHSFKPEIEEKNVFATYNDTEPLHDNNVLLISEKKNRIFLPYTVKEVTDILESSSKYHSASQVISKVFTVPLDKHKNGIISRFKETFNFMRKKEKASLMDSLDFALDLAFNFKLNPAIILACKDLEQLDTYLDCLELNELNKFDYFKIEYEISPTKR